MTDGERRIKVRVLFADSGAFHHEDLEVPPSAVQGYDRLIDGLQEDPAFLRGAHLDAGRLCAAWLVEEKD
jgi:hypothetical protein